MNTNTSSATLSTFIQAFEQISPDTVPSVIACYDPQARFVDPFNDVVGSAAIGKIFDDMFEQLHEPHFKIATCFESVAAVNDSDSTTHHQAFITWDFYFRFTSFRKNTPQTIHGSSHLVFSPAEKILLHRDYWDAAHQIYEQFPILGPVIRIFRNRIAA